MRTFLKYLVIGWSIACIGIFIIAYKQMNLGYQQLTVELYMLKPPVGDWQDFLKVESLKAPGVVPQWFKKIAAQNPKYLEYREINSLDKTFYRMLPIFCFAVWAIPIFGFSVLGILFSKKDVLKVLISKISLNRGLPWLDIKTPFLKRRGVR